MEINNLPTELIDRLPISISVRINEVIMYANHMCVHLAGLDHLEELVGFDASKSIHPDDLEHVKQSKKTPHIPFKYRAMNMQGEAVHLETTIFKAEWEGTSADVYLSRDITNEVQYQHDLERIRDQLLSLHSHINELEETDSIESIIKVTNDALTKTLGYDVIDIAKIEDGYLFDVINPEPLYKFKLEDPGVMSRAVNTGETQFVMDTLNDPDFITGGRDNFMRSELAVPIKIDGVVGYLLNLENREPEAFGELDKQIVESMALHMSHAISRVKTNEKNQLYIQRLEMLHGFLVKANNIYTIEAVTKNLFETIHEVLDCESCSFGVVEDNAIHFRYQNIAGRGSSYPLDGPGVTVRAVNTGEIQYIPDVSKDPDYVNQYSDVVSSELAVPVKIRGEVVAVLNVESEKYDAFTHEDQELVHILAEHAASSLERIKYVEQVERIERERSQEIIDGTRRVTSMVTHDVKGPLSVIRNSVYLLKTGVEVDRTYELIEASVDKINEIINDLGELTLSGNLARVLGDFVTHTRDSLGSVAPPDNVTVEFNSDTEVIFMNFDPSKFGRVIANLSLNAFQAMPDGGVLSVHLFVKENKVTLVFSDTGIGIEPENLSKVFNPYYTTKSEGMGLGLVICKQIVEAHNGSISVESEPGVGTRFIIELPA